MRLDFPRDIVDVVLANVDTIGKITNEGQRASELTEVVSLVPSNSYYRRAPFFVDAEEAERGTQNTLKEYFGNLKQSYRDCRLVRFSDALVTGQGAVITSGAHLLRESVLEFTNHGRAPDGLTLGEGSGYHLSKRVDRVIDMPCILVKRPWYSNFGHWLVDGASVLAVAAEHIKSENLTLVTGSFGTGKMAAVVNETIDRIIGPAAVLQHEDKEIWRFRNLCYVTPPHVPPLFKLPESLMLIRKAFLGPDTRQPSGRKIFVSRRSAANRVVVNEDELFKICATRGFELIDTEKFTISEQAKLFSEAVAVVGAKGAALTNGIFASPECKFLLLSPADFPDPFFWDIVSQLKCDYAELFGPVVTERARGLNNFKIDPVRFTAMLDAAGL